MKKKIKVLRKTVYQRKLRNSMKTTRRINYYMTKEGTLLTEISSNFPIKEYYNENGDIEMVRSKHNSKIIIFNYNKDGNIKSTNNIDTNSDNTIKSNLTSILSYDNDGKISKMELKYHHFDNNNNVHESTVHYQYTDTEKIVYDGKLKEIYTLDNRLKESILPGRIIQYTYDNNGRKISKKVITKYDGSIRNYTYEYSDNSCIEKVENGEIIKYLLNDNDNIIECRDGNDELIYTCEYEYYED